MHISLFVAAAVLVQAAPPEWVKASGKAAQLPQARFLTGFAAAASLPSAKSQAAAQLAQLISVRIESDALDLSAEKNGKQSYEASMLVRASSDVRLSGLQYLEYQEEQKAYALAYVSRESVANDAREKRDRAMSNARAQIAVADRALAEKREAEALSASYAARVLLSEALDHDAIAKAVDGADVKSAQLVTTAAELEASLSERVAALSRSSVTSLQELALSLATQFQTQGLGKAASTTVAPLTYGATTFSSAFGRDLASQLEARLARNGEGKIKGNAVIHGAYRESGDEVRVIVLAREPESGRALGSAEARIKKVALPSDLAIAPQNYQQALVEQRVLAEGEQVSGNLRLEVWTEKGRSGMVYRAKEEFRFFLRVNKPAYVRIVYLLASGLKVPIAQAYYVDQSKVNMAVEYPEVFEISAPFGVERLQAVAFTQKPEPLPTEKRFVDGESYEVVADTQALVKHRGIKAKAAAAESAEAVLTLTTTP